MIKKLFRGACLLLLTALLLCSCGSGTVPEERSGAEKLVIGSDIYEPYFYIGENGEFAGSDVEIAKEACSRLGITPVFVKIQWQNKDEYLENGSVDCLWGCFSMNGREDMYAWVGPYAYSYQVVMVNADSDIYTLSDLYGKTIALQNSSKPEELILSGAVPGAKDVKRVYSFTTIDNAVAALKKRYVDACAGHEAAYRTFAERSEGDFRFLDEKLLHAKLGVAFCKDTENGATPSALDAALKEMISDGTVAKILESYGLSADELPEG